jgi:hypothetical protein
MAILGPSFVAGRNVKWCRHFYSGKQSYSSQKVKHSLTIRSSNFTPRYMQLREWETYVYTKTCIQMFIAALFTIAPK